MSADLDATSGTRVACSRSAPSSKATIEVGEDCLYELKAGPPGGLRPPSGPAATRRSPGNRPRPPRLVPVGSGDELRRSSKTRPRLNLRRWTVMRTEKN